MKTCYVHLLDGPLKHETIYVEDQVRFIFYKEQKVEEYETTDFLIRSDVEFILTVNKEKELINLNTEDDINAVFFFEDGKIETIPIQGSMDFSLYNVKKLSFSSIPFSMAVNSVEDLQVIENLSFGQKITKKMFISILLFVMLISLISLALFKVMSEKNHNLWFVNEFHLMKHDVSKLADGDFIVETRLRHEITEFLNQANLNFINFDIIHNEKKGKVTLRIYVFEIEQYQYEEVILNKFNRWIDSIDVQVKNIDNMYSDYNRIADKYGLDKIDSKLLTFSLIQINLKSNNIKFDSINNDVRVFFQRWGNRYIDFNVILEDEKVVPFEFILKNNNGFVIKTLSGYQI
ncbi:hypothetical protein G7083_07190 [Vibrio sp. HDW18]|uniref:hypothetical protein n=1 Tax=Vibrio TaxID=662 RepID=UPI00140B1939|nr:MULTISPECIES: hypothetical protein [unclassified Vibrio]QIL85655.1 hypothetical protein G7083_07190 [Vibrio sp. HDW18]